MARKTTLCLKRAGLQTFVERRPQADCDVPRVSAHGKLKMVRRKAPRGRLAGQRAFLFRLRLFEEVGEALGKAWRNSRGERLSAGRGLRRRFLFSRNRAFLVSAVHALLDLPVFWLLRALGSSALGCTFSRRRRAGESDSPGLAQGLVHSDICGRTHAQPRLA